MTPASTNTAYCTGAQAVQFFDPKLWGDLLSNSSVRLSSALVEASAILEAELLAATGEIEAALACGGRYSKEDLIELQSTANAGARWLAKMCATLAFWNVTERRYPQTEMPTHVMRVFDDLERLRSGMSIFSFDETQEAGLPSMQKFYDTEQALEDSPVYQNRRMFGDRNLTTN